MASAFGHAFAAYAISTTFSKEMLSPKLLVLGILSSILPDADVLAFSFGIPYESFWGHRGFSHSLVFAGIWAALLVALFYSNRLLASKTAIGAYLFLATASHGLLDGLTSGGKGVAFFAPFDNERYFLPWQPIKVSPIGASKFFSEWGLKVIWSEFLWIGIPGLIILILVYFWRKRNKKNA